MLSLALAMAALSIVDLHDLCDVVGDFDALGEGGGDTDVLSDLCDCGVTGIRVGNSCPAQRCAEDDLESGLGVLVNM